MRHPWAWTTLILLLLPAALPSAQGEIVLRGRDYTLETLRAMMMWVNVTLTEPNSTQARTEADTNGDRTVTEEERAAYELRIRNAITSSLRSPQALVDGRPPTRQEVASAESRGLNGSWVGRTDLVELDMRYEIEFPPEELRREHLLRRNATRDDQGPVEVTVPAEFVLKRGRGVFNHTLSPDGRSIRGWSDGATPLEQSFALRPPPGDPIPTYEDVPEVSESGGKKKGIPGVSPWGWVLALATLVHVRRRPSR